VVVVVLIAAIVTAVYLLAWRDGTDTTTSTTANDTGTTVGETITDTMGGETTTDTTAGEEAVRLLPASRLGSGWGYIDPAGAMVIEPRFGPMPVRPGQAKVGDTEPDVAEQRIPLHQALPGQLGHALPDGDRV
jgi:hypothetical protein